MILASRGPREQSAESIQSNHRFPRFPHSLFETRDGRFQTQGTSAPELPCVPDARLVLSEITFLVGHNGAGKSTMM
jgi:ABC-type siderophore export system fused ATPase/permease subunit